LYKQLAKQLSAERCACKPLASHLLTQHASADNAIYGTLTNIALDLLGVGSTDTACL